MTLHEKIYYCRKKAGYSQEEMAEKLNVSRQAVSKWETGEAVPELAKFNAISKLFGITTDWLLSDDDSEPPSREDNTDNKSAGAGAGALSADTISDSVVGTISKLWQKFGWLTGVILAIGGAAFTGVSLIGYMMFERSSRIAEDMFNSFNSAVGDFGMYPPGFFDDASSFVQADPSTPLTVGAAVFGVVLMIAGIAIVIIHRKKYGKK